MALVAAVALVRWRQPVFAAVGRSVRYVEDVRAEIRKVTWPGWEELRKSTVVIIIFVIIVGLIIAVLDAVFAFLLVTLPGRLFA